MEFYVMIIYVHFSLDCLKLGWKDLPEGIYIGFISERNAGDEHWRNNRHGT